MPVSGKRAQNFQVSKEALKPRRFNSADLGRAGPLGQNRALPKVLSVPSGKISPLSYPAPFHSATERPTHPTDRLEGLFQVHGTAV